MAAIERKDRKPETDESNRQVGCFSVPSFAALTFVFYALFCGHSKFDFFTVSLPQESARIANQTDESNRQVA